MESNKTYEQAKKFLKDKEKLFDTMMDAVGDLISIQDLNMRIVYQNKAMKKTMGSHEKEYCYEMYEKRDSVCDGCPIVETFKTGRVAKSLRTGILPDGTPNRFEVVAAVLKNAQGKVTAGIEIVRDVEEKERALDELKKFKEITTNREIRMIELKKEITKLKEELEKLKVEKSGKQLILD